MDGKGKRQEQRSRSLSEKEVARLLKRQRRGNGKEKDTFLKRQMRENEKEVARFLKKQRRDERVRDGIGAFIVHLIMELIESFFS